MLDYFLKQSIKSGLKRYKRERSFYNYRDIENVLIFFDIEDWYEILPIIEKLTDDGKRVTAWTIRPNHSQTFRFPPYVRVVEPQNDLNWLRLLKPEVISEFEKLHYDTLFDLSSGQNDYILYLLTQNKSRFCIGLIERDFKLYDFILLKDQEQNLLEAFNQMKNFMQHIQQI